MVRGSYPPTVGSFAAIRQVFLQSKLHQFTEIGVNVVRNREATPDEEKDRAEEEEKQPEGEAYRLDQKALAQVFPGTAPRDLGLV
jgi:hypothetical protein